MTDEPNKKARVQLALIALLFFGPLAVAALMYYGGFLQGTRATANHGTLMRPVVVLKNSVPGNAVLEAADGQWLLVSLVDGPCEARCQTDLYTSRQSREMLGRDRDRLQRVLLHGAEAPDTVFISQEHPDLMTAENRSLSNVLENNHPASQAHNNTGQHQPSGYFLIDPLGNLVMHFEPDLEPAKMVEDIEHLLRLSRIG